MVAAVGINLGTTNTVVSAVRDGVPVTLTDSGGRRLLPSVVSFHPSGKVLVGHSAKERRIVDPTSTVFSVKRLIGRAWESAEVQRAARTMPFELAKGDGQEVQVVARGEQYTLPEISAFILRRAKAIAEAALGETVKQAVITVPANFNDPQREATKLAGKLAGLEVLRILSEPTAAALAYGETGPKKERVVVYDLGGGTFDVTLLDVSGAVFQVLGTGGDTALGGDDIDELVAGLMNESLLRQHRYDARTDPTARATLKARAEELKILLSSSAVGEVSLDNLVRGEGGQFLPASFRLERSLLETIASPLLEKTLETCRRTIEKAGLKVANVDRILLVGGSTRMPLAGRRVEEWFGKQVSARVNPDEVVAHGAAVQAASLARGTEAAAPSIRPRPSFSFAVGLGLGEPPAASADAARPASIPVPPPPKVPGDILAGRPPSAPPPRASSAPPDPRSERPDPSPAEPKSGAAWPPPPPPSKPASPSTAGMPAVRPSTSGMPAVRPSTSAMRAVTSPSADAAPASVGPVSRSSRPPLSHDQEALLKAFLAADAGAPASPPASTRAPTPPPAAPSVPPSAVADIEDELRAFLSDAPPPETKSPSDVPAEIISEGIESVPEAPDLPPLVVPQRSKPPVPPPRAGVLPSATFHPAPVISDAPPVATARGKAPPLPPKTAGGTLPSPVITTTGAGPSAPPLVPKGPPPKSAGPLLIDVTPLSLGVETVGGFCDVIIRANSPVPCDRSRVFQTASDNQTSVVVKICQGESERFAENTTLGDLRLSGFRPAPRGEVAITVLFEIDADGILNVQAKEVSTGRSATARIELLGAQLDAAKVQAMMNRQAEREVA